MADQRITLPLPSPLISAADLKTLVKKINDAIQYDGYAVTLVSTAKTQNHLLHPNRATIACDRHGKPRNTRKLTSGNRKRLERTSKKCECPMRLYASFDETTSLWSFENTHKEHNYKGSDNPSVHAAHRTIPSPVRREIARYAEVGTQPRSILAAIKDQDPESNIILKDIHNSISRSRRARLDSNNVAEALIRYLESLGGEYFWHFTSDDKGHIEDLFLCNTKSIDAFKRNHDVLILDCTYKTNRYKIPLLNLVAVTGHNTSLQLAVVFLQSEKETHYTWAISLLRQLLNQYNIPLPIAFFTDQEIALVNAIEIVFPSIPTVLCLWHIYKNVATYAKKHGNAMADIEQFDVNSTGRRVNIQRLESPDFIRYMATFTLCIRATTEEHFEEYRSQLRLQNSDVTAYLDSQYLNIWKHKIAACFLKNLTLFGLQSTSRGEGSHHTMKSWLRTSKADIYTFWSLMDKLWRQQFDQYSYLAARAAITVAVSLQTPFWASVNKHITNYALQQTLKQWERRSNDNTECSGIYKTSMGMPCKYVIHQLIVNGETLKPEHFHAHWWIHRDQAPYLIQPTILPPRSIRDLRQEAFFQRRSQIGGRQQASHQQGRGTTGNRRIPSAFELDLTPQSSISRSNSTKHLPLTQSLPTPQPTPSTQLLSTIRSLSTAQASSASQGLPTVVPQLPFPCQDVTVLSQTGQDALQRARESVLKRLQQ